MLIGGRGTVKNSPAKKVWKSLLHIPGAAVINTNNVLEIFIMRIIGVLSVIVAAGVLVVGLGCREKENTLESKAGEAKAAINPRVELATSKGRIVLELDSKAAPVTVVNFLKYVQAGHYNGLVFHRVIPGFMIQGGGFDANLSQKKPNPPIVNEGQNGLKNSRGTIAMARTNVLDSATSQFFINLVNNNALDYPNNGGYAVFGKVVEGMEVVDAIAAVKTTSKMGMQDVPAEAVVIQTAKVLAAN
jgi:peptidyl-prolyl cis-trans isomerase A (cyclophilin A)